MIINVCIFHSLNSWSTNPHQSSSVGSYFHILSNPQRCSIMSKFRKENLQIYFGILIWILIFPFSCPILIFLSAWKGVVLLYIKIRYFITKPHPLLEATNFTDTMFCTTELTNTITYAFLGEGIIDGQKLRSHFYNTFIEDGKDEQVSKIL
jgi:hypothetical protein